MRKKILIYVLSIYIIMLLQSTLIDYIKIYNIKPNLPLVFIVAIALLRGNIEGAIIGFFVGLTQDMLFGSNLGFYTILGMYTGFAAGSVNKRLYRENFLIYIFFAFIATLLYEFAVFAPHILYNGYNEVIYAIRRIILPEAVYNGLFSIFIYIFAVKIHHAMEKVDKSTRKY